ncbi:flavin reductase [Streptomyces sp. NBC_01352]|uniref:flavin reductase n=1 Tax=Streptomyces sp. NBC_01352 TaxID=2903834 RepID=UPI002E305E5D|nr:flavin reductase [Streptomyces sp. NBC_01352]
MPRTTIDCDGTDRDSFRRIAGHLASGVTVITTSVDGRSYGMTASSVTSLSLDPPTMLACLNRSTPTAEAVLTAGMFGINVLGTGQEAMASQFAVPSDDKFRGVAVVTTPERVPLLRDAHAQIECQVAETIDVATHRIVIGRVVRARALAGQPLTYYRGGFGRFQHVDDEKAYDAVRALILSGGWVQGFREGSAVAKEIGIEESAAFYALTRLSTEGIVEWLPGEGYGITAFDVRAAEEAYEARSVIELGVIRAGLDRAGDDELARLSDRFEDMAALMVDDMFTDTQAFMEANFQFHRSVIALAHNTALLTGFERLHLAQIMARLQGVTAQSSHRFIDVQRRLLEALQRRDADAAAAAVLEYTALAKARARELAGGSVCPVHQREEASA